MFKKYVTKPERVEAIKITMSNIEDVAKEIGGRVNTDSESGVSLEYPSLSKELFVVLLGDYLTKDSDGRLSAVAAEEFEDEFKRYENPYRPPYTHSDF